MFHQQFVSVYDQFVNVLDKAYFISQNAISFLDVVVNLFYLTSL